MTSDIVRIFPDILKNGHFISVCRFMHSINVIHYDLKLTTCVSFMIAIRAVTSDLSWNFFSDQWPASFDDIWSFGTSVLSFGDFDTTDWFQANDLSRAWMWAPKLMLCICRFIFIYKLSLCSRLQAVLHAHWNILSNPFCVSYRGVGQLQLHGCWGQHWVVELIKDCLRHYTDIGPQIT